MLWYEKSPEFAWNSVTGRKVSRETRSLSAPPCGKCGGDEPCRGGGGRRPRKARSCVLSAASIPYRVLRCIKSTALRNDIQCRSKEKLLCIYCNNGRLPLRDVGVLESGCERQPVGGCARSGRIHRSGKPQVGSIGSAAGSALGQPHDAAVSAH